MKKRLRKKLRLWEFQEMGFHVNFELTDNQLPKATDALLNDIIAFAEANGLFLDGGINFFYVTAGPRHSVTVAQRELFANWLVLSQRSCVTKCAAGSPHPPAPSPKRRGGGGHRFC